MRKALVGAVAAASIAFGVVVIAPSSADDPESCYALNPVQPKCKFVITTESTSQTITGAVGQGSWKVVVKRGKEKFLIQPSTTDPEPIAFDYEIGDKVTARATAAGSWVLAGHD